MASSMRLLGQEAPAVMPTVIFPGGSQSRGFDFLLEMEVVMADQFVGNHHGGVFDEEGREFGFAHFGQMRGVGGIVAADDQEEVHRFAEQFFQGVLAFLGGAANCVEKAEMAVQLVGAEALDHGVLDAALHFLGFAAEHGGLVGDADGLQVDVRIEAGGISAFESLQKFLFVAAVEDVVADVIGLGQGIDDQIMARRRPRRPGRWWPWFPRVWPCRG